MGTPPLTDLKKCLINNSSNTDRKNETNINLLLPKSFKFSICIGELVFFAKLVRAELPHPKTKLSLVNANVC